LGAWLDIFPLDGYPGEEGDRIRQQVRKAKRVVYTTITDVNTGSSKTIKAMKKIVTPLARRVINPYKIVTATDNYVRKQSTVPTSMLASYMSTWSFVLKCPIEHVFNRTLLPFEDRVYWGPRDYEGYLEIEFGKNWRTPICDGQHIVKEKCYFIE
jgi:phosphorylcholine metabolism protein LicD